VSAFTSPQPTLARNTLSHHHTLPLHLCLLFSSFPFLLPPCTTLVRTWLRGCCVAGEGAPVRSVVCFDHLPNTVRLLSVSDTLSLTTQEAVARVCSAYACRLRTVSIDVDHLDQRPHAVSAGRHTSLVSPKSSHDAVNHALKCKRTDDARRNALLVHSLCGQRPHMPSSPTQPHTALPRRSLRLCRCVPNDLRSWPTPLACLPRRGRKLLLSTSVS
jgi:hypothetical protein